MKIIIIIIYLFIVNDSLKAQNVLIPFRKGNLWGYANEEGKIIVEPKYNRTYLFGLEKYKYFLNKNINNEILMGLIKKSGEIIIEPIYNYIYEVEVASYITDINAYNYEDKYYREYCRFKKRGEKLTENYFVANTNANPNSLLQNYIDSTGKILLKDVENINIIKKYRTGFFNFIFQKNKLFGVADNGAKIIVQPKYEQLLYVKELNNEDYYIVTEKGRTGVITANSKIIIPFAVQNIKEVKYIDIDEILFRVIKNKQQAIYNNTGKKLIGFTQKYIEVKEEIKNSKTTVAFTLLDKENNEGNIMETGVSEKVYEARPDEENKPFSKIEYNRTINNKKVELFTKDNLYGLKYTDENKIIIEPKYKRLVWCTDVSFQNNVAINYLYATTEKGVGIINSENKIIIPIKYKDIRPSSNNTYYNNKATHYIVTKNNLIKGVLNHKNEMKIPFKYKEIEDAIFGETDTICNFFVTNKNDLIGIVNSNNKIILPDVYNSLVHLSNINQNNTNSYFLAKQAGKGYGIIDKNNIIILPIKFDSILNTSLTFNNNGYDYMKLITSHYFPVIENKKYAFVKSNGDYIIPPQNNTLYKLLNPEQYADEYYAVIKIVNEEKSVFVYGLISNKRIITQLDSGYYFQNYNVINNYKKGIIQIENLERLQGIAFTIINKIIPPIYYRITNSYTLKNNKIQYYELEKRLDNGESYIDIINENGLQFFEN